MRRSWNHSHGLRSSATWPSTPQSRLTPEEAISREGLRGELTALRLPCSPSIGGPARGSHGDASTSSCAELRYPAGTSNTFHNSLLTERNTPDALDLLAALVLARPTGLSARGCQRATDARWHPLPRHHPSALRVRPKADPRFRSFPSADGGGSTINHSCHTSPNTAASQRLTKGTATQCLLSKELVGVTAAAGTGLSFSLPFPWPSPSRGAPRPHTQHRRTS